MRPLLLTTNLQLQMALPTDPKATPDELPPENPDQFLSSLPSQKPEQKKEETANGETILPEENPDKFLASLPSSKKTAEATPSQTSKAAPVNQVDPEVQKKQEFRTKAEGILTKQNYKPAFDIPADQLAWGQQTDPKNVQFEYEETHPDPQHTLQTQKLSATDDFRKEILMRLASGEDVPGATEQQRVEAQKLRDSIDTDKPLARGSYLTNYNTPISTQQQEQYRRYVASLPKPLQNESDYDLQGYWLKYGQHEEPQKLGQHMTDEFKKPNHVTFSNESIYHNEHDGLGAKHQGGKWYDYNGTTLYQPSAADLHNPDRIKALQEHIAQAKQAGDPDGDVQLVAQPPQGAIPNVLGHEDTDSFLSSLPSQQNQAAKQTFMQVLSQYDPNNLPAEAQSLVSGLKDPKEIQSLIEMGIMPDINQIKLLKENRDKEDVVNSFFDNLSQGNIGAAEGDWLRGLGLLATGAYEEGAVPLMRGINQIVYHDLPGFQMYLNPTLYTNALGITNQPLPEDQVQLTRDVRGIPGSFVNTAEQIKNTIAQAEGGGVEALDNFLVKHGFRTSEQALNNEVSRTAFKVNDARARRENESSLGRGMAEGGVLRPYALTAATLGHQILGPSIPQILKDHPELNGDYEKAAAIQRQMAETKSEDTVKQWITDNELNAPNPDVEFVESLGTPGGNIFAVAGDILKLGKFGTAVASQAVKAQRVENFLANRRVPTQWTPEVQAKLNRAEDIRAARPGIAERVARQVGLPETIDWTAPARKLANLQDAVSEWLGSNVPKPLLHAAAPYVAGGAGGALYGAITNPEHPIKGAVSDLVKGELAVLAWKAPRIISDIGQGAKLGGRIGWAEGAMAIPETDKVTRFVLSPTVKGIPLGMNAKAWDWIGQNLVEWGKLGVEPLPLTIAMGTLQSADNDDLMKTYGQGLMFAGSHRIMSNLKGENPYKAQMRRAKDDERIKLAFKDADADTVNTLNNTTNWNLVVKAQKSLYQDVLAKAEAIRKSKGEDSQEYQAALGQVKRAGDQLFAVQTAGAATRREYNRQALLAFTNLHEKINGVLRAGQTNTGIHVLTLDQIVDRFLQNNRQLIRDGKVDEARNIIKGLFLNKDGEQSVAGVRYMPNGGLALPEWVDPAIFGGAKHLVFDPLKPSAVINADALTLRGAIHGNSLIDVINHEGGHLMYRLPKFREDNAKVEELLFGQGYSMPDGTWQVVKPGAYTPEKLFDMYNSRYMAGKSPEEQLAIAKQAGIWDSVNNRLNYGKTVQYMKEEVLADVAANSLRKELSDDQDGMLTHLRNWAKLNADSSRFARLTQKIVGLGGPDYSGRMASPSLGLEFSPEVMYAQRQATDALASMYGNLTFDMDQATESTKMSKATILGNKKLLERYGKDSGLVKTEMQATITDADGKPIQTDLKINNPASPAGTWVVGPDGKLVQKRGYGQLPDELQGKTFAPGTVIEVGSRVVYHPDGVTPVVNSKGDIKKLLRARGDLIRKAMQDAYDGTPGSFNPWTEDELSFKGTFSPSQIKAIQDLPENIIPLAIKEKILRLNELLAEGLGRHAIIDYSTHIDEKGNYVSTAPKIRDIIPLSMGLSKDGNFYVTTVSWDRLLNKLALWQQRMPGRLAIWNGDPKAFLEEFRDKYLMNIQRDIPNKTGLAEDPTVSEQKRNVFQDFINIVRNDSRELNPDRTNVPLTRGETRKKTDYNNVIRSFRADAIMDLMEHPDNSHLHPIDYGKIMANFMPAKDLAGQARLGYESDLNEYTKTHRYDDKLTPIHGFRSLRDSQEGAGILQGDRLLKGLVDSLREAHRTSEQADAASESNPASAQRLGLFSSGLREQEKTALTQYAAKNGLLKDYDAFTRAFLNVPQGKEPIRGAEHEVVIGDPVIKRSQAGLNNDYLHYSDRIIAHTLSFPESAPKLSGVQVDPRSGAVFIETEQPYLPDTGEVVPEDAKRAYMMDRGFYTVTPSSREATSFYNPETGVHVDDLHNGNIIMTYGTDGNPRVAVIDPQIRATTNNRWDTELREQVFQNNPELKSRMLNPEALPAPRENRGNVRRLPAGRMGIDVAGMEEVKPFPQQDSRVERAKAALQQLREGGAMMLAKPITGSLVDEASLKKLDALGDKNSTQVDADTRLYKVNPNPDSVALPPRWSFVNRNIVGMPRSFKEVTDILDRAVARLQYVAAQKPNFAKESARFYRDMAESSIKMADGIDPSAAGLEKWLLAELNMRFLALGSPRTAVAANATKSSGSAAAVPSSFEAGYKIGFGDQSKGSRDTYKAWQQGQHFDLNLPGVQDKVRSFYINGLSELIEMAEESGDTAAAEELRQRAGKSLRVLEVDHTNKLTPEQNQDIQRLLDGKATIDMWDMAAKGFAWPGYLLNKAKRNNVKQPFQWSQDKFSKDATIDSKAGQQVLKELGYTNWSDLRYQEARALRLEGNSDWNEQTWEERKAQPFAPGTKFTYFTEGTEAGLTPGGGGPLYDAQQGINGLLADRLNELGMAGMFGKTKLKARNAQEILWALEKLDNPVKANNDLSLFGATFDPFLQEINKLRQGQPLDKKSRGANVLAAMDRAYNQMARQIMPLEVVTQGTSPQAERVQGAIAALEESGDKEAVQTITYHVANGLHDKVNELATKHNLDVTVDSVDVGKGGYTEGDQVNVAPNMRIILRGSPADNKMVLEALSRSLDQDGGNIIRKPTVRELNDANVKKNFILTLGTGHLDKAARDKMFLDLAELKDAEGNSFLTGFTETDQGVAIGDQFYGGNMEEALKLNEAAFAKVIQDYGISDYELAKGIVDMFFRGQEETEASRGDFQTDLDTHIASRLAATPGRGVQFPQVTDAAELWSQRADDLFRKLPTLSTKTKQNEAKIKLKSDLEAAVLRGVIDEQTSDQLKAKYGFKEAKTKTDEETE